MQTNTVKAFRQRLIRAGFTNVRLSQYREFIFLYCISPYGREIEKTYMVDEVSSLPRKEYVV